VRLGDGYEGWMHEGYLEARGMSANEVSAWRSSSRYSLGCTVLDAATGVERALPLGARVAHEAKIVAGEAVDAEEMRGRYPSVGSEICASAARWFANSSYQWGGITPWGADCSGMVQAVFGLHGVALPRDARQQAELGTELALSPDTWRPGDLLFFSDRADGRITHVAIAAPERTLMHVAIGRGGFVVESPYDSSDPYVEALKVRLRQARRILTV
jgi:cell wall-associated NlpC family hydrolase